MGVEQSSGTQVSEILSNFWGKFGFDKSRPNEWFCRNCKITIPTEQGTATYMLSAWNIDVGALVFVARDIQKDDDPRKNMITYSFIYAPNQDSTSERNRVRLMGMNGFEELRGTEVSSGEHRSGLDALLEKDSTTLRVNAQTTKNAVQFLEKLLKEGEFEVVIPKVDKKV